MIWLQRSISSAIIGAASGTLIWIAGGPDWTGWVVLFVVTAVVYEVIDRDG